MSTFLSHLFKETYYTHTTAVSMDIDHVMYGPYAGG